MLGKPKVILLDQYLVCVVLHRSFHAEHIEKEKKGEKLLIYKCNLIPFQKINDILKSLLRHCYTCINGAGAFMWR